MKWTEYSLGPRPVLTKWVIDEAKIRSDHSLEVASAAFVMHINLHWQKCTADSWVGHNADV